MSAFGGKADMCGRIPMSAFDRAKSPSRSRRGTVLGGAVAVWPLGASRAAGIPGIRIQYASWSRFTGLNEAGYVEGQNVAVEYRWAENQSNRLPALAADLVRRQVALGTGGWGGTRSGRRSHEARVAPVLRFSMCKDYEFIRE
jgi:hypothetical protein